MSAKGTVGDTLADTQLENTQDTLVQQSPLTDSQNRDAQTPLGCDESPIFEEETKKRRRGQDSQGFTARQKKLQDILEDSHPDTPDTQLAKQTPG